MATKYMHTNIVSENWEQLVQFYQEVFDCVPVPPKREQEGEWLAQGTGLTGASLQGMHLRLPGYGDTGPTLEIYQYGEIEPDAPPTANRKGFGHIAFLVDSVSAIREAVLDHGGTDLGRITETEVPGVGHLTFVYMLDPEGNILEIQNWS
ncbi:VOC family protein [Oligoflexia bacterium]|nr:VOC family protein [Oligoflexia bacterium]